MKPSTPTDLGRELVRFFEELLRSQRGLGSNTVRSYRDALLLLLQFTSTDAKLRMEQLQVSDLTAERVPAHRKPQQTWLTYVFEVERSRLTKLLSL